MHSLTLLCAHRYFPTCGSTLLTYLINQSWTVFVDFSGATGEGFGVPFSILSFAKMCHDSPVITLFQMQPWPSLPATLSKGLSMLSIPATTQLRVLTEDRWVKGNPEGWCSAWWSFRYVHPHPGLVYVASSLTGTQGPRASPGPHDPSLHGPGGFQL